MNGSFAARFFAAGLLASVASFSLIACSGGAAQSTQPNAEANAPKGAASAARRASGQLGKPAADNDLDGLGAGLERALGIRDAAADTDTDTLSDYMEWTKYRTDPYRPDGDGDGTSDRDQQERAEFADTIWVRLQVSDRLPQEDFQTFFQDTRVVGFVSGWVEVEMVIYPNARPYYQRLSSATRVSDEGNPLLRSDISGLRVEQQEALKKRVERAACDLDRAQGVLDALADFRVADPALARYEALMDVRIGPRRIEWRHQPPDALKERFGADGLVERLVYAGSMFDQKWTGPSGSSANLVASALRSVGMPARIVAGVPLPKGDWMKKIPDANAKLRVAIDKTQGETIHFWAETRLASNFLPVDEGQLVGSWAEVPYMALFAFDTFEQVDVATRWPRTGEGPAFQIVSIEYKPAAKESKLGEVPS
jgi:hypothetical protein